MPGLPHEKGPLRRGAAGVVRGERAVMTGICAQIPVYQLLRDAIHVNLSASELQRTALKLRRHETNKEW